MSKDRNDFFREIFNFARLAGKDVRYAKGLILVGSIVGFLLGAYHGFGKNETTLFEILLYMVLMMMIMPVMVILFLKYDKMYSGVWGK